MPGFAKRTQTGLTLERSDESHWGGYFSSSTLGLPNCQPASVRSIHAHCHWYGVPQCCTFPQDRRNCQEGGRVSNFRCKLLYSIHQILLTSRDLIGRSNFKSMPTLACRNARTREVRRLITCSKKVSHHQVLCCCWPAFDSLAPRGCVVEKGDDASTCMRNKLHAEGSLPKQTHTILLRTRTRQGIQSAQPVSSDLARPALGVL